MTTLSAIRLRPAFFVAGLLLAASFAAPGPALASGPGEDGVISHYEVDPPATLDAAEVMLRNSLLRATSANAAGEFEEIHEASYSIEAAVARLREALPEGDEDGEALADIVEIVHLASELGDGDILAVAVPRMKTASDKVLAAVSGS